MTEVLIEIPDRDYALFVDMKIKVQGNRNNFLEDRHKLRDSLNAALDTAIKESFLDG
jgi:hypothetical protein